MSGEPIPHPWKQIADHGERLSRLEANYGHTQKQLDALVANSAQVDGKLDTVLKTLHERAGAHSTTKYIIVTTVSISALVASIVFGVIRAVAG